MSGIKDVVSGLAVPAACLGSACALALLWLGAITAWERLTNRRQNAAWARSTRADDWAADMNAHIDEAELGDAVDAAISPQLIAQLQQLYVLEEETQ